MSGPCGQQGCHQCTTPRNYWQLSRRVYVVCTTASEKGWSTCRMPVSHERANPGHENICLSCSMYTIARESLGPNMFCFFLSCCLSNHPKLNPVVSNGHKRYPKGFAVHCVWALVLELLGRLPLGIPLGATCWKQIGSLWRVCCTSVHCLTFPCTVLLMWVSEEWAKDPIGNFQWLQMWLWVHPGHYSDGGTWEGWEFREQQYASWLIILLRSFPTQCVLALIWRTNSDQPGPTLTEKGQYQFELVSRRTATWNWVSELGKSSISEFVPPAGKALEITKNERVKTCQNVSQEMFWKSQQVTIGRLLSLTVYHL